MDIYKIVRNKGGDCKTSTKVMNRNRDINLNEKINVN